MVEEGFLLGTFQNNHIPLFSAFFGDSAARVPKSSVKASACLCNNCRQAANYQQAAKARYGAHLAEGSALERSPLSDAHKAEPSIVIKGIQVLRGSGPGCREASCARREAPWEM